VCVKKNQRFLLNLGTLSPNYLEIFPSTSGSWDNPQLIFQKHWKCLLWVAWESEPQGILRNQSIRGFFGFKSSFQNCFWNVFSTSGFSQTCKKRNVWKFPVLSQGIFWSHALKNLLGVQKHHFGRKFIQQTQK
jgi:hypothetical protein